ncbi:MAG: Veg family protein [Raoultibacter sp.]
MDLAKQAKIVDSIHDTLDDFIGQRLRVRANMGRSKIVECEGVLTQVHPQLFIMEVDRKRGRTARQSYQYVDVLTGMVELSQGGEPLFDPFIEETPVEVVEATLEGEEGAEEGTEAETEAETEEVFA